MQRLEARYLKRHAAVYIRFSTPGQVKNSQGSRAYQEGQKAIAEACGYLSAQILMFSDEGISGANPDRAGFLAMCARIERGEVGAVLMFEASRGARDEVVWFTFLRLLEKHDVMLFLNGQGVDTSNEMQMVATKLQSVLFAEESRRMLSRMHHGRLETITKFGKAVSAPPAGYVSVRGNEDGEPSRTGKHVRDPDPAVQRGAEALFEAFRVARTGVGATRLLRAQGQKIPCRKGKRTVLRDATVPRVHRMLCHPAYAGAYIYGRKHYELSKKGEEVRIRPNGVGRFVIIEKFYDEPYITMEEFEQNQRTLASNRKGKGGRAPEDGSALVSRLIRCARHGAMQPSYADNKEKTGRAYYRCMGDVFRTGSDACIQVPDAAIAPQIIAAALAQFDVPVLDAARSEWRRRQHECDRSPRLAARAVRRQQETVEHLYQQARGAMGSGLGRAGDYLQRKIEDELAELERLQTVAKQTEQRPDPFTEARWGHVVRLCSDIAAIWAGRTTTNAERRQLLALVVNCVTVEEVEANRFVITTTFQDGSPVLRSEWVRPCYWHRVMWTLDQAGLHAPAIVEELAKRGARNLLGNAWNLETVKKRIADMRKTNGPQPRKKRRGAPREESGPACRRR